MLNDGITFSFDENFVPNNDVREEFEDYMDVFANRVDDQIAVDLSLYDLDEKFKEILLKEVNAIIASNLGYRDFDDFINQSPDEAKEEIRNAGPAGYRFGRGIYEKNDRQDGVSAFTYHIVTSINEKQRKTGPFNTLRLALLETFPKAEELGLIRLKVDDAKSDNRLEEMNAIKANRISYSR